MADVSQRRQGEDLFRRESRDHISSPDQLYDYIRVNSPKMWTILLAFFFLGAAGIFWVFTAVIPVTFPLTARQIGGGRYLAYVSPESAALLRPGTGARIGTRQGEIVSVAETPLSRGEALVSLREDYRISGDYAAHALGLGEWNVALILSVPAGDGPNAAEAAFSPPGVFERAVITSARIRPLDFFSGN
ncbi:MAG: hypothetical protein LBQ46_01535 [Treponema sp.]|jgi:hypothetical protein|nr:hypothetical protein [Treponema sp.]